MKKVKASELPLVLDEETINILVEMAMEFPKTNWEWAEISEILSERGMLMQVLNKVQEIEHQKYEKQLLAMTEKEKEAENLRQYMEKKEWIFIGNMGEPETAEEYKYKYGVYPPNYKKE